MNLFNRITNKTTLLTPNRRLTAVLTKKFNEFQIAQNKKVWMSIDCLPLYPTWLERTWQHYSLRYLQQYEKLLSSNQESVLWEKIVQEESTQFNLLHITEAAKAAKSAWETLKRWQIKLSDPALPLTENSRAFLTWAYHFQKICRENNWIDQHSLCDLITEKIQNKLIKVPEHLLLIGFTEIAPQYQNLLHICEEQGTTIEYEHLDTINKSASCIGLTDSENELLTMARWAKSWLDKQPNSPIGCIIPNLDIQRDSALRIFSNVFQNKDVFNISAGKKLTTYPIIQTALKLLSLNDKPLPFHELSRILRSPFLGESEREQYKRANLDAYLRQSNTHTIHLLDPKIKQYCPMLATRFENYLQQKKEYETYQTFHIWTHLIVELLTLLGWPGERIINSEEYQVIHHSWLPLLNELATFDSVLKPEQYENVLHYLTLLANQTVFQPETPEAPIQILGLLEAAGMPFEAAWVMGLDDTSWPLRPRPNPFIPRVLQKKLKMPNASAERELSYCKELMLQLKNGAKQIIFSYPLQEADYELRASNLLQDFPIISCDELTLTPFTSPEKKLFDSQKIEFLQDEKARVVDQNEKITGGVSIFKEQAACPFKAFAKLRLHAKPFEETTQSLRAVDRGSIVHKALEIIWRELMDSQSLKNQSELELKNLISKASEHAIESVIKMSGNEQKRYLTLEKHRLEKIILEWLNTEKERPDFKVIAHEQEKITTVANIPITIRIDRIDELANGDKLIIDYKTGKYNHANDWFGERLDEPQLPLYCILDSQNTVGISFAEVHPDLMKMNGVSKIPLEIKSIKLLSDHKNADAKLWEAQLNHWQLNLNKLAEDFYEGNAHVDPKDLTETCNYCNLQSLCRVYDTEENI